MGCRESGGGSLVSFWEGGRAITGWGHRRRNRSWGKGEICLGSVQEAVETVRKLGPVRKGPSPGEGQRGPYSVRSVVWTLLGSTRQLPITRSLRPNSSFSSQNSTERIMRACVVAVFFLKGLLRMREGGRGQMAGDREKAGGGSSQHEQRLSVWMAPSTLRVLFNKPAQWGSALPAC